MKAGQAPPPLRWTLLVAALTALLVAAVPLRGVAGTRTADAAGGAGANRIEALLTGVSPDPGLPLSVELRLLLDRSEPGADGRRRARLVFRAQARGPRSPSGPLQVQFAVRTPAGDIERGGMAIDLATASQRALDVAVPASVARAALRLVDPAGRTVGEAAAEPVWADLEPLPGAASAPAGPRAAPPIRVSVTPEPVVSGSHEVTAAVSVPGVERILFLLDGRRVAEAAGAPWRASIPFAPPPRPRTLEAVALDASGSVLGRDVLRVGQPADEPWLSLLSPYGPAGRREVGVALHAPSGRRLSALDLLAGERLVALLTRPPFEIPLTSSQEKSTFLRAVAVFDDGSEVEDVRAQLHEGADDDLGSRSVELLPRITDGEARPIEVSPDQLEVVDGDAVVPVSAVLGDEALPLRIGLVVDESGSMKPFVDELRATLGEFLRGLRPFRDLAFVLRFAGATRLSQGPTSDPRRLEAALRPQAPAGETALYDGLAHALAQFRHDGTRRALVLLSDGDDTASQLHLKDVVELARRLGVPIYAVALEEGPASSISTRSGARSSYVLSYLARTTGGSVIEASGPRDLARALRRLLAELRAETLVTFEPPGGTGVEPGWRPAKLRAKRSGVRIEGAPGYWAGD
jgi:VWFA-related protein